MRRTVVRIAAAAVFAAAALVAAHGLTSVQHVVAPACEFAQDVTVLDSGLTPEPC
ncbi:hypothetical protein [Saccharopolyspora hordei]|uniref:Uncharacterized protein n=1 Tax=Saccharopolyspora hordei TaxID=1838 RepID=A0A853AHU2_9PSEU|nr:hypothetical protein [Saccharopolyspora hordei]NYI83578.1 hypothetical protein [Saccharopolyspora hordei]